MATSSTNFVSALGGGSGIDIKALAQNLVDAEKKPKEDLINEGIRKTQSRISGYSTVQYALTQVQSALDALKNPSLFSNFSAASSKPTSVAATVTGTASAATHEVLVENLAQGQRSVSVGLNSGQQLNGGTDFLAFVQIGSAAPVRVPVDPDTPEAFVSAINAANLDVKASLVDTGSPTSPLKIVLTGKAGAANAFSISTTAAELSAVPLGFPSTLSEARDPAVAAPNRRALDASVQVDGLRITRNSNQLTDVIPGVTLNLLSATVGDASVITTSRDSAPVKEKIKALVTNYNDLQSILDAAFDKDSTVEGLGGTLVGDTSVRSLRDQIRKILMPDSGTASSGNAPLTDLRQLGVVIDSDGKMKFATLKQTAAPGESLLNIGDEGRLDQALAQRPDDVATLFSGPSGIAKDMSDRISGSGAYIDSTYSPSSPKKILNALSLNAGQRVSMSQQRLKELEDRMNQLLERYTRQFSIMESLVGESKSTRTGLENSFKGMSYGRG